MDVIKVYNGLRYCPACGKELKIHPVIGWKACFLHGNLVVRDDVIVWDYMPLQEV
jgi:hypothetical protein